MTQPNDMTQPDESAGPTGAPTGPVTRDAATPAPTHGGPVVDAPGPGTTAGPSSPAGTGTAEGGRAPGRRAGHPSPADRPAPAPEVPETTGKGGVTAATWIALILGAVVLVLLLVFVVQNNVDAQFEYFGAAFTLPLGVAMLLAAIAGALVMALVGSVRMIQMGWTIRRMRRQEQKLRETLGA